MKKRDISYDKLHDLFHYDPLTGLLAWKKNGKTAGSISNGYWIVGIEGKQYLAHRIAYCMQHGYFSEHEIDHINRNGLDNRIENLREVSRQCNARNTGKAKNNTSGVKGVSRNKQRNKWYAYIKVKEKLIGLGHYKRFEDAVKTRYMAECELNWNVCDSDSPAKQYLDKLDQLICHEVF